MIVLDEITDFIKNALHEDVKDGDHTSLACIPAEYRSKARLLAKDEGVIAGVKLAEHIFKYVDKDSKVEVLIPDGSTVKYGDIVLLVECNAQALLKAERLVLNAMQRMSGIATMTRKYVEVVEDLPVTLLDTRKTTPLNRFLEKWSVKIGGAANYRVGLYDWIMIKDNHIDACGGITKAITKVAAYQSEKELALNVTVEVRNFEELEEVLQVGQVTRIMLDNFTTENLGKAVKIINKRFESEASGGITIATLREKAETGVDYISIGALTHSNGSLDLSLKVIKE